MTNSQQTALKESALKCPACGSFFRSEDVDAARGFLTCSYCRALVPFSQGPSRQPVASNARPLVPLPPRFTLDEELRGVRITRRWFSAKFVFFAFFCVVWNGFLIGWYSMAAAGGMPLVAALVPILHVGVGAWLSYFTLAGFLNTTTIQVRPNEISVHHGPLPWPNNTSLDPTSIDQLYCKERIHNGKNGTTTSYEVWVAMTNGTSKKILSGLDDAEQALFVEQRIERALDLVDRPMSQELRR